MGFNRRSLKFKAGVILVNMMLLLTAVLVTTTYFRSEQSYIDQLVLLQKSLTKQIEMQADTIRDAKSKLTLAKDAYDKLEGTIWVETQLTYMESEYVESSYILDTDMVEKDGKKHMTFTFASQNLRGLGLSGQSDYELPPVFQVAVEKAMQEGTGVSEVFEDLGKKWISVVSKLYDSKGQFIGMLGIDFNYDLVTSELNQMLFETVAIGGGIVLVFVILVIIMIEYVVRPLQRLSDMSLQIAGGDLSVSIPVNSKDEIGTLSTNFNTMAGNIRSLLTDIKQMTEEVAESSERLSVSAEQTSKASVEVAGAIEEMAAGSDGQMLGTEESKRAMEEMASGVQRIAESSSTVSELATGAAEDADQGNDIVESTRTQMTVIHDSVEESLQVIRSLENRTQEIGQVLDVIASIASQTNLLALNASIEAARVGEQGKGFAVVAGEVRKLAEQTRDASVHIATMLTGIQNDAKQTAAAMEAGAAEVNKGTKIVGEAGEAFGRIRRSIRDVSDRIHDVSALSEQMSAGSEEVAASLEELSRIARDSSANAQNVAASTEEQLAAVDEISSSASRLRTMASTLQAKIQLFKW